MRALLPIALMLAACGPLPPVVEPMPPDHGPVDPPDPVGPDPGPAATACERAADNFTAHHCDDATPRAVFVEQCRAYEQLGSAARWDPECMARQSTCDAIARCRGGQ